MTTVAEAPSSAPEIFTTGASCHSFSTLVPCCTDTFSALTTTSIVPPTLVQGKQTTRQADRKRKPTCVFVAFFSFFVCLFVCLFVLFSCSLLLCLISPPPLVHSHVLNRVHCTTEPPPHPALCGVAVLYVHHGLLFASIQLHTPALLDPLH